MRFWKKGKSKRVRMSEAFRATCAPVLYSLGFRNPKRVEWERWANTKRNIFIRWRGDGYDEVHVNWWNRGRPRFHIEQMTRRVEANPGSSGSTAFHLAKAYSETYSAWLRDPQKVIERARDWLTQIDPWFREGEDSSSVRTFWEKRHAVQGDHWTTDNYIVWVIPPEELE
jgi:hypothetical protein